METRTIRYDEMICLSKNLNDEYVNMFAKGANLMIKDYHEDIGENTVLIRSITKRNLIHERLKNKKTFYYMDSGYIGNYPCEINPNGNKLFHRIVKNGLQHHEIIPRPPDRWERLKMKLHKQKRNGNHILLVLPSEKPCKFYNINLKTWTEDTVKKIKQHTNRPIVIRSKPSRSERITQNSIYQDLEKCHALVTFNSIAAVESVLYGVPAFTLAPTAADPVCDKDLSLIENPTIHHIDKLYAWAHHLAYGQFHINELKDGTAYRILTNEVG